MRNVLLLSFYYPPDIGPGALRAKSIVDSLIEASDGSIQIDVLTTIPHRYHSFATKVSESEQIEAVSIQRVALPPHQNGMADQAKAFLAYAKAVNKLTRNLQWDVVIATSSRLMTATLGASIAKRCNAKLYLDIRDLFTDSMEDILAKNPLRFLIPLFRYMERWTFHATDKINVVSAGFLPHINHVAPCLSPTVFTNGIDDEFIAADYASSDSNEQPVVLYAGNIGAGQGLHHIIPTVASILSSQIQFRLLGDGGRRKILEDLLNKHSVKNARVFDPVPRCELFAHYRQADVLFLHLNDHKAFRKVLPSKIFEYAATGKPILAGVSGYAAEFLHEQIPGVEIFEPCNATAMQAGLWRLLNGPRMIDRSGFCAQYLRKNIMHKMGTDILALAEQPI